MNITERAAYIKGLAEGLGVNGETKEGKIIVEMLTLIGDMADKIEALDAECTELREYVEELDEDLGQVEEDFYVDDDEEDDEDEDVCDEDDSGYYELVCPSCGETICFDDSLDTDELVCPACGERVTDIEICDGNCDACDDKCEAYEEAEEN
jgi:DNA-directed RNA polymerase subunit RPC12/RpoP